MKHLKFEQSRNEAFSEIALLIIEEQLGVTFPSSYVDLMKQWNGGRFDGFYEIKLSGAISDELHYYLRDGFWGVSSLCGITLNSNGRYSIANAIENAREWGLPDKVVPLEGDGHTWVALDYRQQQEPTVIFIESGGCNSFILANSFSEFLGSLIPYEQVYDSEGNIIYQS